MMKAILGRSLAAAVAIVVLFTAERSAAQAYPVTTWTETYKDLEKYDILASGNIYSSAYNLNLPADFVFRFFGQTRTTLRPGGYGGMSVTANEFYSCGFKCGIRIPSTGAPNGGLFAWYDYFYLYNSPFSDFDPGIHYKLEGEKPNRVMKVEWKMFPYAPSCCVGSWCSRKCEETQQYSKQVWIYESPDGIENSLIQFRFAEPYGADQGWYASTYAYSNYEYLQGIVGIESMNPSPQAVHGLPCSSASTACIYDPGQYATGNDKGKLEWPTNKVIMFGRPSEAELIASIDSVNEFTVTEAEYTLDVTTTVRNVGNTAANGVTYDYYLSRSDALDPDQAEFVARIDPPFDLAAAGGSSTTTLAVTNPRPDAGWYYLCAFTDPDEAVAEKFEGNNRICSNNRYLIGVDFIGTLNAPRTAGPGDDMPIDYTITNIGTDPALLKYRFVMSADRKIDDMDVVLYEAEAQLEPNGSAAESIDLALPPDIIGNHEDNVIRYLIVQFDPDDTVPEADENNNLLVSPEITLIKADLRVDTAELDMPDGCFFGREISATLNISNNGAARGRNFDNAIVLSDNGVITSYDQAIRLSPAYCIDHGDCEATLGEGSFCIEGENACSKPCTGNTDCVNELGVSEGLTCLMRRGEDVGTCRNVIPGYSSQTVTFGGLLPLNDPNGAQLRDGTWFIGAVTDFYDVVNEGNEANNARLAGQGLQCFEPAPDFTPVSLRIPAKGAAGEQLAIRRGILNRGNLDGTTSHRYYLSSNEVISQKDMELQFAPNGGGSASIAAGKLDDLTDIVELPTALTAGNYYIGLIVDPDLQVKELSETNNVLLASTLVDVKPAALRIATSALPPAVLGVTYQRQLVATGGAGAYSWKAIAGRPLPEGLRIEADGMLIGRPTREGTSVFGVTVRSGNTEADALLVLTVLPATGPLTVQTELLPAAYVDVDYRVELAAVGGAPPYAWSLLGRLPEGLELRNNTINGQAQLADGGAPPRTFRVQVRDSRGITAERELKLPVLRSADLSIQTTRIQDGLVQQPYQQIIRATGGEPPYEFAISGLTGTGLSYNKHSDTTALVSGIPEQAAYYEMTVTVTDQSGQQVIQTYKFAVIGQAIHVQTDRTLPNALRGIEYRTVQLVASVENVTWEIFDGELPEGIDLSTDGVIAGTPDKKAPARNYTFLVRVFDGNGNEGYGSYSIFLEPDKVETTSGKAEDTGCNSSSGSPAAMVLPLIGAALVLLRRRRI